jgi:hypothetical protein
MLATLIDTNALLDVLLVSFGATLALVLAFGTGVLATDRIETERGNGRPPAPWLATLVVAALGSAGIVAIGVWAMTQKS